MNKLLSFCKKSAFAIKVVFHIACSSWTFQVLINKNKVNRGTRRFERSVNTICLLLSPIISIAAIFFTLVALAAIIVAGVAGCVVEIVCCRNLNMIENEETAQAINNSHVWIVDTLKDNPPAPLPGINMPVPIESEEHPDTSPTSSETLSRSLTDDDEINTSDEDLPSFCALGMM